MRLLIRADASSKIGTGHVMRCLALAQAWQDAGGEVFFATVRDAFRLEERLRSEGIDIEYVTAEPGSIEDAEQTAAIARNIEAGWIVVDGYHFGAEYQRVVKEAGLKLLFIDDNGHANHYYADIVLNQNIHASEAYYSNREPYTHLILGAKYVLLRREFLEWRGWQRQIPDVAKKILVTMGGSDPNNVTLKVLNALRDIKLEGLEVRILVGGGNPHLEELKFASKDLPFKTTIEFNISNVPEVLAWSDLAVSSAGSTCWEMAYMGLPAILIAVAENQVNNGEHLGELGIVSNLEWHKSISEIILRKGIIKLIISANIRGEMAEKGRELVDGRGAERAARKLNVSMIQLRPVSGNDIHRLWEWANDPEVRAVSFSPEFIPWEEHIRWFENKLCDNNCFIYIAYNSEGEPVGQVRFDISKHEAVISASLDKKFRGMGLGREIIKRASEKIFTETEVNLINAYVKHLNDSSLMAFKSAGYRDILKVEIHNQDAYLMTLKRRNF